MDVGLLSFNDGHNLEDKKQLLRRIHDMNQLQVCRLDTIQINEAAQAAGGAALSTDLSAVNLAESSHSLIRTGGICSEEVYDLTARPSSESFGDLYDQPSYRAASNEQRMLLDVPSTHKSLVQKALDQISICPAKQTQPRIVNLHQTFTFPKQQQVGQQQVGQPPNDCCTQTSKTLLDILLAERSNDLAARKTNLSRQVSKRCSSGISNQSTETEGQIEDKEYQEYMESSKRMGPKLRTSRLQEELRSRRLGTPNYSRNRTGTPHKVIMTPRKLKIRQAPHNMSSNGGGGGGGGGGSNAIGGERNPTGPTDVPTIVPQLNVVAHESMSSTSSLNSEHISLASVVDKIYNFSWEVTLSGMHELLYIAPSVNWTAAEREICLIYRKLLDFFRSPRSSVGRVACQVSGEMFRIAKCARRPEFDELVEVLLTKTADTNRFIQRDSNVALDKMVSSIPLFQVVRAICNRGPTHKNPMVRTTVARLLICTCALNGNDSIMGINANSHTRKRVLCSLSKFLLDKNLETRKYGERLCTFLQKHRYFQEYFFKDLEPNIKFALKKIVNGVSFKVC